MKALRRRLASLEDASPLQAPRIVWCETGQTEAQALAAARCSDGDNVLVISWSEADAD